MYVEQRFCPSITSSDDGEWFETYSSDYHILFQNDGAVFLTCDYFQELWSCFQKFVDQWKQERGTIVSVTQMSVCPAYQKIIAMGPAVVPLILKQLEIEGDNPDHWFWALRYLVGINPISEKDRGNMKKMAKAWLDWAEVNYKNWSDNAWQLASGRFSAIN
jgi:hypothetical protein